jgi:sirohydrochlorin cobaltochelatase
MESFAAVLLIGHGSRDLAANHEFESFVKLYALIHPKWNIKHAYVSFGNPKFKEIVKIFSLKHNKLLIIPVFLFPAYHVKQDILKVLRQLKKEVPEFEFEITLPIGIMSGWMPIIIRNIQEAPYDIFKKNRSQILFVGISGRVNDLKSKAYFETLCQQITDHFHLEKYQACFFDKTKPLFPDQLGKNIFLNIKNVLIMPYLLWDGKLFQQIQSEIQGFIKEQPHITVYTLPCLSKYSGLFQMMDNYLHQDINEIN